MVTVSLRAREEELELNNNAVSSRSTRVTQWVGLAGWLEEPRSSSQVITINYVPALGSAWKLCFIIIFPAPLTLETSASSVHVMQWNEIKIGMAIG